MIPLPTPPVRGQRIQADLLRDLIAAVRRCRPIQGQGILLQETLQGTVIALAGRQQITAAEPFDHRFKVTARAEGDGESPTYALHIRKGALFTVEGELAAEQTLALEGLEQDPDDADAWRVPNASTGSLYIRKNPPTPSGGSGSGDSGSSGSGDDTGSDSGSGDTGDDTGSDSGSGDSGGGSSGGDSGGGSGDSDNGSDTPKRGYTLAYGDPKDALFIIADFTPGESSSNPHPKVTQRLLGDRYAFKGGSTGGLTVGPPELITENGETALAWFAGTVAWAGETAGFRFTRATAPDGAEAKPLFTLPLVAHRKDHAPGIPYAEQ